METVFRAYDIRGVYNRDITLDFAYKVGLAFGEVLGNKGTVVVGRDARTGGPELQEAVARGLVNAGVSVTDVGMVPIPVLNFWCIKSKANAGIMISASHNPPEYNGIRFRQGDGTGFISCIPKIKDLYFSDSLRESKKRGSFVAEDNRRVIDGYIDYVTGKVKLARKLRVVLDPGNGAASGIAKKMFESVGCEVIAINDFPDGSFPGRGPYPNKKTLSGLQKAVKDSGADFGAAYDGDSDRVVIVDDKGKVLSAEETGIVLLREIFADKNMRGREVALNIDCSMVVEEEVKRLGGQVRRIRVGDVFLAYAVKEGAVFAMESSNHFIVPSLFPFDDGLAVSLYFAEALSRSKNKLSETVRRIPEYHIIRKEVECPDSEKFDVIAELAHKFEGYKVTDIDGVKVDFEHGWALVRASNTQPILRVTSEARSLEEAQEYLAKMDAALQEVMALRRR